MTQPQEDTPVRRPDGKAAEGSRPRLNRAQVDEAIRLTAAGVPSRAVGRIFGISHQAILNYLKEPRARERLLLLREHIKHTVMERTAEELVGGAATVAQERIREGDAKGLDAATRAILNLEKASASAAGEHRKVELSGPEGAPLQIDVRAILAQIAASVEPAP